MAFSHKFIFFKIQSKNLVQNEYYSKHIAKIRVDFKC